MNNTKICPNCGINLKQDTHPTEQTITEFAKKVFDYGKKRRDEYLMSTAEDFVASIPTDDKVNRLIEALKPFAKFACNEPCDCNNCIARNEIDRISGD